MEAIEHGTLLRRVLQRAARAARAVALISTAASSSPSSPTPATAAAAASRLSRTPSLLDCIDDDGDDFFYTPSSSPSPVVVHNSRPSPAGDVDRRAAEFIERFRRINNESLELRYLSMSPLTPVKPPVSPETYFKLSSSRLQHGGGSTAAQVRRKKISLRPKRTSGGVSSSSTTIKWPTDGRPTVRV